MCNTAIDQIWSRIERILQTHAPDTADTLAPPANDRELAELETAIRLTLPADLRASLTIHNGQIDPTHCHAFSGEGIFLSATEIADHWKMLTEIDDDDRFNATPGLGPWWKTTCIPFTDAEGNMLCVDMDSALGNRMGEVVCHVHDSEIERGLGASFKEWLASLADRLDAGQFRIDDYGYLSLDTEA